MPSVPSLRSPSICGLGLLALAAMGGCAGSDADATAAAGRHLSSTATAYVAVPEDGRFGTKVYAGSGSDVAALVAQSLSPRLGHVKIAQAEGEGERSPKAALAEARAGGFTYLIVPRILRWEDHDATWSAGPDRAKILVEVIHAASGDAADVAIIEALGAEVGIMTKGPGEALEASLAAYAGRLVPLQAATGFNR